MILITAPTSTIGSQLVDLLLEAEAPLRLLVRDPSRLAPSVRERTEVVVGSHGDGAVVDVAADGVDGVFWLTPNISDAPTLAASFADFARPAAEAFARHDVRRIVGISAIGRGTPQSEHAGCVTASLEMDDVFAASGVPYRAVVSPSFMDNLLNQVDAIKEQGTFSGVISPDLKAPTVATRDLAATSARLLRDTSWTGVGEVACLGPQDLSPDDQAHILSDVLDRSVTYVQTPGHAFKARMTGFGMGDAMAQGLLDMFDAKNAGLDNALPRTAETATPTTFEQWCREVLVPAVSG